MKEQATFNRLKQEYEQVEVPAEAMEALQRGIQKAKKEKRKSVWNWKTAGQAVAAASVLALLIVPNVTPKAAMAVSEIPGLNKIVELVTINRFDTENTEDSMYDAHIATPELKAHGDAQLQSSVGEINQEVKAYASQMIAMFQREMEQEGGVYGLDIIYNVVTDTDDWFTLQILTTETMASGAETLRYYNLDKKSGRYVSLDELFPAGYDYVAVISENIREQMVQQMAADEDIVYNLNCEQPEDNFQQIAPDQMFYRNQDGQLVIVFNEYDVAPGFMGCPEFVIDDSVLTMLQEEK